MRLFDWLHWWIGERVGVKATPDGLKVFTTPGRGSPLLYRFPQPLHPLECMAADEGFGGWLIDGDACIRLGRERVRDFLPYTAVLAEFLRARPQDVRLCWHACTPLSVPTPSWDQAVAHAKRRDALWVAVGKTPEDGAACESKNWDKDRLRPNFWRTET